ncbi:hypothetical protein QR680_000054 [Steinernema hermaphroditum]|uniref:LIM zinc-binding domain-containing protein n=1 Tax=Steinernema hermaphroditum TaxID=289476 RepID=A0AA39GT60_9BILA|nr:hypothetical protein QR680_000054 [Steinernema hermaphroditum]
MSYLSPLPHYPAVRSRSLSSPDLRFAVEEECYPRQRPHLHPLYANPQRYWRVAGGHQPIVTGTDILPHYVNTSESPKPMLDSQTLQYAGSRLRKTEYGEPFRSDKSSVSNERMGGTNQHMPGRDWQNSSFLEELESYSAGKPVHATSSGSGHVVPFGDSHRYANPVNTYKPASPSHFQSYSTSNTTTERLADPRSYIRHFATTTPAYDSATILNQSDSSFSSQQQKRAASQPRSYVHELRDSSLTQTQRYANQFQESVLSEKEPPSGSLDRLRQLKDQEDRKNDHLSSLIRNMEYSMRSGRGAAGDNICSRCEGNIDGKNPGCTALDRTFHVSCFTCEQCGGSLAGGSFYNVNGKAICEKDYEQSLERCAKCGKSISDKLLRASGNAYHPACFTCTSCLKCLDGVAFTLNSQNEVHCVDCFHDKYAPRCAICSRPIIPEAGEKDSVRVIAMDKSFHVNCYRCEDCGLQLSSQVEGHGCYPLDQHLYCKNCNSKRLTAIAQSAR